MSTSALLQVIHRIFPFARGLYEDKVSNFWCATSLIIKWRKIFGSQMPLISAGFTLTSCLPTLFILFKNPSHLNFIYSLAICSLSFFIFSVQVHEKSILFPLLPFSLLASEVTFQF